MAPLSLSQLLDVAIGTPEVGAVNFTALYSLLQAMLGHLGLQDLPAQERGHGPTPLLAGVQPAKAQPGLEKKGDGTKTSALGTGQEPGEQLPGKDPLLGTAISNQVASVATDVGQMKKDIEANESSISKAMALSQDLLEEITGLKEAQSHMGEDIQMIQEALGLGNLQSAAGQLPGLRDQTALDNDVKKLKERLSLYPAPEEVSNMVRWEVLEDCLVGSKAEGEGGGGGEEREGGGREGRGGGGEGREGGGGEGGGGRGLPVEGSGGQSAPTSGVDTQRGASSAPGLKAPGTQLGPRASKGASKGTPGTQSVSKGVQTELQGETVTPEKRAGAPSHQTRTSDATPGTQPGTPGTQTTTVGTQPAPPGPQEGGAGVQPSPPHMEPSIPGSEKVPAEASPSALGTKMDDISPKEGVEALPSTQLALGGHPAAGTLSPATQGFETPLNTDPRATSSSQEPTMALGSLGTSGVSDRYAETVEALRHIGQLRHLYADLKEQVVQLEATKLDHTELEKLRLLFLEGDQESITSVLADLRGRASSLRDLAGDLQGEKGKIRQLEDALGKLETDVADLRSDGSNQMTLQQGSMLQEVKQELEELKEQQEITKATAEELATKMQEQLDKLRVTVESGGQGHAEAQAACPVCSSDISVQVGQLLQRYEKLQELVDSFMARQPAVGKVVRQLPGRSQEDEELLKRIQAIIMQVQGDYEKLQAVMGNLLDDRHQKQKDIEALFQSLKRLEKEKVDKEALLLEIDVKADKAALAGKVSRTQFDASMEQLNKMIQEMLSRVTGQEQGWNQVQQRLSEEMRSKLDRLELGPFRQQLEEHWKDILDQLEKKMQPPEADDAAGIRKQLLAHFHCLSCDRPLSVLVPGPHTVAIPSVPSLLPRLARHPSTVLEREQTQQHGHREQEAKCGYPSVPRQCGGQHTLTHAVQRGPRLQSLPPGAPQPVQPPTLLPFKHDEMELLGRDGHIYRGRRDGQLPVLVGKEGFPRDKRRLSPRQWDSQDSGRRFSWPQSTKSSPSPPGTAASPERRSASAHGHLPQVSSGLFPPLQPPRDGSSTPAARQGWGSPTEPPPSRPPSRQASGSGQQQ